MLELLPGVASVILENADVLQARVALKVLDALRGQPEKLLDFVVAGIPELAIMAEIFNQHLVGADGAHAVVETIAATRGLTFNPVKRQRMHHRTR
jgi:hypothetical protein